MMAGMVARWELVAAKVVGMVTGMVAGMVVDSGLGGIRLWLDLLLKNFGSMLGSYKNGPFCSCLFVLLFMVKYNF